MAKRKRDRQLVEFDKCYKECRRIFAEQRLIVLTPSALCHLVGHAFNRGWVKRGEGKP